MASGEFDLIDRHFSGLGAARDDVVLGVGDDAALLSPGDAPRLGVAWGSAGDGLRGDPLGEGERCAESAMRRLLCEGAIPAWLTLALSIDDPDDDWTGAFATGVDRACTRHRVSLVGGDTTAGTTAATVFASGPMRAR